MTGGKSRLGPGNADDLGPKSAQLAKAQDKLVPGNQNNSQPPPFPAPGGGDQDRIAALEAQIEDLTQQNAELLHRRPGQSHPEMNRDEHEEEERNSHTDSHGRGEKDHREDDHQEDNFRKVNPRGLRNRRLDHHGDRREDARDLNKVIAELERRCTYMEMERKDKSRSLVVDKFLMGTDSPFIKRVANYRLPEKFKVEEFINQEETLKAMASSRQYRETALKKKRKEFRKADGEEQSLVKKFQDYNFTPLNAGKLEVLMEIKRDPEYRRPTKDTRELVRFLGEQRNQPRNNRPQNCRYYQPQDRPQLYERDRENNPREDIERREDRGSRSPQRREPRQDEILLEIR
ncbi:uncharacterized protein LOC133873300 [Alnus glutinosa]|uniref:uncharacterized protein LOC133873300 n=1 Tax=Alnus glutinosa TaxID=3517 RepID=UPI002D773617|nr:uncharacterized protein LOC133873300 [Alnus glutinosa]